jgi:NAD(P)-dependent dehydrogenase (short-subunit alcohol dehydrogenase family)
MNPLSMEGRNILVTGASSGLGIGICRGLADQGARVIMVARDAERLQAARAQLSGDTHVVESFDISQPDAVAPWLKEKALQWGPLHGAVHSAGTMLMRPLRMITAADWDIAMRTNVVAASALAKGFRQAGVNTGGGSIVFISSVTGLVGQPAQSIYGATKGALIAMARSLALELAREKIRVNCVAPAVVEAGMSERIRQSVTPEQWSQIVAQHPLGLGRVEDVANAVLFLLADTGRWITGSTLVVDGGFTAQ